MAKEVRGKVRKIRFFSTVGGQVYPSMKRLNSKVHLSVFTYSKE